MAAFLIGFAATPSSARLDMVPIGGIIQWPGALGAIPPGYQLCDGTNGTPDMRDRFVMGAGSTFNPGDSGGQVTHAHPFSGDGHEHDAYASHSCPGGGAIEAATMGPVGSIADTAVVTGTTESGGILQPYFALAFIQRMS